MTSDLALIAVCLHPDEEEHLAGELLAAEADLSVAAGDGWYVSALSPALRDELVACARAGT